MSGWEVLTHILGSGAGSLPLGLRERVGDGPWWLGLAMVLVALAAWG